jgi:hypothetical protein
MMQKVKTFNTTIVIINQFIIIRPKKKEKCHTSKSHGQRANSNQNYINFQKLIASRGMM